ncbi:TPA: ECs_2282 family putative zinc-binding protein [Klebsiella variicola subsp. variicola]|uniref:ECs_2282 family putative zinc-binding protein n=1 Tax=Klebsiella variicola TaxID=244366 RepID=UPI003FA5F5D5
MHRIKFKCPGCGHSHTLRSGNEVRNINDIKTTICCNCGIFIHKDDLLGQNRNLPGKLVQGLARKRFR